MAYLSLGKDPWQLGFNGTRLVSQAVQRCLRKGFMDKEFPYGGPLSVTPTGLAALRSTWEWVLLSAKRAGLYKR